MATTDLSTPSSTQGWKFNHIGIRVADLEKSLFFYEAVLGMKEMTRMAMDTITFVLLGYPEGGDSLFAREGVLELVWSESSAKPIASAEHHPDVGFVKLCFTMPDRAAAMARLREYNVTVRKEAGSSDGMESIARAIGVESPSKGRNKALWDLVKGIAFVEDPDGYLVELIPYQ